MTDDLEAGWQREKALADAREAREKALADCDDMLAVLRQREAEAPARSQQQPQRLPEIGKTEPTPRQMYRDWNAEQAWVEKIIDQRVGAAVKRWVTARLKGLALDIAGVEGEIVAEERAAMRREIEDRIGKSDAATVELILGLERKIEALEQRAVLKPTRPQLVAGDPDAA